MIQRRRRARRPSRARPPRASAYEWARFGATRPEWRRNFFDYMQPYSPEFFRGLTLSMSAPVPGATRASPRSTVLGLWPLT